MIDSLVKHRYNVKLKKTIVNQPEYEELGLTEANSKNVDASLRQMVEHYETKFGKIELFDCDFDTSVFEKSTCENDDFDKKKFEDVVLVFRNNIVINALLDNKDYKKVAVIYGKAHVSGIKEELITNGFVLFNDISD